MKLMPASTQSSTQCYVGHDVLGTAIGWENVPTMYQKDDVLTLNREEEEVARADDGPFVVR
jgi:hypothetical protein